MFYHLDSNPNKKGAVLRTQANVIEDFGKSDKGLKVGVNLFSSCMHIQSIFYLFVVT